MTFAPALLPDAAKEQLCRSLLAELGVERVTTREEAGELDFRCVMPWHTERNASAGMNYRKLTFNCFACGSHGGLLWLVGVTKGLSGPQARAWLDGQTGLGGADFDLRALLDAFDSLYAGRAQPPPMPRFSPRVLDPWALVHPYLTEVRGVPLDTIEHLQVGWDPAADRVVIPHFWRGDLVGWQSRRLDPRDGTPKYLSTADFPRDRTLYDHDPSRRDAVVVESAMSVLRHRHHAPMEATFGAAVTDAQARLLAAHPRVVLWMDNDEAGWRSVLGRDEPQGRRVVHHPGLGERLQPYCDVRVVDSPYAADPADMDDDTVDALVRDAVPFAVWSPPERLLCWTCRLHHVGGCL